MKRFLALLIISATCLSLLATTADARRFGGGGSIGKQRTMSAQPVPKAPAVAPGATPTTPPAQPAGNKWLGPLAGLAIGAGLGALFAHFGMGEGMGTILMIILGGVVVMFLISLFRRPQQQAASQYASTSGNFPLERDMKGDTVVMAAPAASAINIPADFPVEAFLRSAKTSFIRLQTANDRKDLNDIREYTTPEMFAEISMQLRERDSAPQQTDVLSLNTELLEVVTEGDHAIASVRMTGQTRENNGAPENFDEVWHVQKNMHDEKAVWLLSGIQQVA